MTQTNVEQHKFGNVMSVMIEESIHLNSPLKLI